MIGGRCWVIYVHRFVIDGVASHVVVRLIPVVVVHLLLLRLRNAATLALLASGSVLLEYRFISKPKVELSRFNFFVRLRA